MTHQLQPLSVICLFESVGETTISAIQMEIRYHPAIPKSQVLKVIHPVVKDDQSIDFDEIPIDEDDPPFR